MAAPPISARLTCGRSAMRWNRSWNGRVTLVAAAILSGLAKCVLISPRSAPAENTLMALRMCSTVQSARVCNASRMPLQALNMSALKAFTGGRLSVTVAMPSATLRETLSAMACELFRLGALASGASQAAADDEALDVVGALIDLGAAHAAIDALDGEVRHVTGAAQRLDGIGTDPFGGLGGDELCHRCFDQTRQARILAGGGVQSELTRRLEARRHIGQPERYGLVLEDRLAEGTALVRVPDGDIEGCPGHADALRGNADASALQVGQGDAIALPLLAQAVRGRHEHVVEADLAGIGGILA